MAEHCTKNRARLYPSSPKSCRSSGQVLALLSPIELCSTVRAKEWEFSMALGAHRHPEVAASMDTDIGLHDSGDGMRRLAPV